MEQAVSIVTATPTPTAVRETATPEGIGAAHDAVVRWCDTQGERRTGVRWEVYGHWDEEHPEDFETEIYWLVS